MVLIDLVFLRGRSLCSFIIFNFFFLKVSASLKYLWLSLAAFVCRSDSSYESLEENSIFLSRLSNSFFFS